jgi:homogentisate phytyltransferase / homogentisate geranylgeranyltransferase
MKQLITLWQFSRPHTIIGSFCSITTLYLLALQGKPVASYGGLYGLTLLAALACNVFIVGLNQLIDVELDKINKPYLPLAAGTLQKPAARIIIFTALVIALTAAAITGWQLLLLISIIIIIGVLYSVPPIQLKKHHVPAAICISLVRGLLVNIGMLWHFTQSMHGPAMALPTATWPLTVFITAFSIAIAWFKDLPDTTGDAAFHIKTFPLLYNKAVALRAGAAMVLLAYGYTLVWAWQHSGFLLVAHAILAAFFVLHLFTVTVGNHASIKKFYLRFWVFFFAEYAVFGVWAVSG